MNKNTSHSSTERLQLKFPADWLTRTASHLSTKRVWAKDCIYIQNTNDMHPPAPTPDQSYECAKTFVFFLGEGGCLGRMAHNHGLVQFDNHSWDLQVHLMYIEYWHKILLDICTSTQFPLRLTSPPSPLWKSWHQDRSAYSNAPLKLSNSYTI